MENIQSSREKIVVVDNQSSSCKYSSSQGHCFAIDLHGVVLQLSIRTMIDILFRCGKLHHFIWLGCNLRFVTRMIQELYTQTIVEQAFDRLLSFDQFAALQDIAFAIINAQKPRPAVIKLLQQLKKQGHTLIICSNIGPRSLALLEQKYPDLFALFTDRIVPQPGSMLSKPNALVYQQIQQRYGTTHQRIILIDDRTQNLQAAIQEGIVPLQFNTIKRLQRDLLPYV